MSFTTRAAVALALASGLSTSLYAQGERPTDQWVASPVDDRTFETYLEFFAYESDLPLEFTMTASDTVDGLVEEQLTFQSTPGMTVTGRTHRPLGTASLGGVVFLHGGVPNGKDSPNVVSISRVMARAGWTVLTIDMLYFGGRKTDLLQTFSAQEKAERLYNQQSLYLDFAIQTVKDVGRAFDVLVAHLEVPANRIALVGRSRGAQMGMIAGGAERRFAAVVLLHGGHFDALENGHRPAACGANYLGRINPRPLLMINGEADTDYLPAIAVRPMQRLLGPQSTVRWTDASHGIITEEDLNVMVEWLRKAVPE